MQVQRCVPASRHHHASFWNAETVCVKGSLGRRKLASASPRRVHLANHLYGKAEEYQEN